MATYLEIYGLKNDADFKSRVGTALVNYATYLLGQPADRPWHEQEVAWSRRASVSTDDMVYRVMGFVLGDPTTQAELGDITDAQLQTVVEIAVGNNMAVLM
jgi:hypothetical protein